MMPRTRILLLAGGAVGPLFFWVIVVVDGLTKPRYSAGRDLISDLARGSHGWVQSANFVLFGICLLAFAGGLFLSLSRGWASRLGTALVGVAGVGLILAGIFSIGDGPIHSLASLVTFVALIVACFVFAWHFRYEAGWHGYRWFSLGMGILAVVFLAFSFYENQDTSGSQAGLAQRLFVATLWLWIEVIAVRALRSTTRSLP
jgi:hypothetical membrane protein